jgi:hypothetical protein
MSSLRKRHRHARCRVRLCGRRKWIEGYLVQDFKVTKAAARRRAKTLGLKPKQVPHGMWLLVVTGAGWHVVPAKQVKPW